MKLFPRLEASIVSGIAFSIALALPLSSHADLSGSWFDRIQAASWHSDIGALSELSKELNAVAGSHDPEAGYAAAYADYRLASAGQKDAKRYADTIQQALDRAESRLTVLGQSETPRQAESLALLAAVYGLKIAANPLKGPVLGILSGNAIERAEKIAPDNPRVLLIKGVVKLHTPVIFGGDATAAMQAFDAAIERLPRARFTAANWGLDDAYIWRGIALKSAGRGEEAQASFEQALNVAPEQEWARTLLAEANTQH